MKGASLNNGPSYSNGPGGREDWPHAWWHLVEGAQVQ